MRLSRNLPAIPAAALALFAASACSLPPLSPESLTPDAESVRSFLLLSEFEKRPRDDVLGEHLAKLGGSGEAKDYAVVRPDGDADFSEDDTHEIGGFDPWAECDALALEAVLVEAFRVNPSLEAARAQWESVAQRYPQVTALDDPQLRVLTGAQIDAADRGSLNDFRQRYQFQQFVPFYGKRRLRGEIALSAADAAAHDITGGKLLVAEAVKLAYFDYLMVYRKADLHEEDRRLVDEQIALLQRLVERAQADESALRQAKVERIELMRRQEQIFRVERLARAKINTLLHRPPDAPLPPPRPFDPSVHLPDVLFLRGTALEHRPDLAAAAEKIEAAESAVKLAIMEWFPDFYLVGRLDVIDREQEDFLRTQIGFNMNVPIRIMRRKAAYHEAEAALRKCRAEHRSLAAQIEFEVQTAWDSVCESRHMLDLYPALLEAVEDKAESLEARRHHGPAGFHEWLSARRELIRHRAQECDLRLEYYRRVVELERLTGTPLLEAAVVRRVAGLDGDDPGAALPDLPASDFPASDLPPQPAAIDE